jgi:hypothetical protein
MDKLAEWGIAAHHSGRWVAERESDAMGTHARQAGNGAAASLNIRLQILHVQATA